MVLVEKNSPANAGDLRDILDPLGQEDPLEEGKATHSGTLAWRIPWTEEPDGLLSAGSQRVGHNWSNLAQTQKVCFRRDENVKLMVAVATQLFEYTKYHWIVHFK